MFTDQSAQGSKLPDPIQLILRRYSLRYTAVRRAVLWLLQQSPSALSGGEIEKQLGHTTDRITLYRTLRTFEQNGLVHRIIDHCGTVRYAVSGLEPYPHSHVHFKCTACSQVYCLHEVAVPVVLLPVSYQVTAVDYLISGLCDQCPQP
jgi:Fur family ferric uptake transcriptional regulator